MKLNILIVQLSATVTRRSSFAAGKVETRAVSDKWPWDLVLELHYCDGILWGNGSKTYSGQSASSNANARRRTMREGWQQGR